MLMELMGLYLLGLVFVYLYMLLCIVLMVEVVCCVFDLIVECGYYMLIGYVIDEKVIVNGIVVLFVMGGLINYMLYFVVIVCVVGILIDWNDFDELLVVVLLFVKIYLNGKVDVNYFYVVGGVVFLVCNLFEGGLLYEDVMMVVGKGLVYYMKELKLIDGKLMWVDGVVESYDMKVLCGICELF